MSKIYDCENIIVFEKKASRMGKNRTIIEIPARLRSRVQYDVKYLVVLIPIKKIVEQEI